MTKERKATGQRAVVCHPIGKATGIKTWPEDDRPREKLLKLAESLLEKSKSLLPK